MKRISLLVIFAVSLGCGANVRDIANRSVELSYLTLKSAEQTYHTINKDTQTAIVDNATAEVAAKEALNAHREKAQKIYRAFAIAYTSIGAASTAIGFADIGNLSQEELIRLILDAKVAVEQVIKLIKEE